LLGQEKCEKQTAGIEQRNKGNVMHTNGTSKQGKHIGQTREGQFNGPDSRNGFDNFQNFPTQSPICSRNDGLSSRLDGITFSKWRNESIKAAGNAVVPQVVYQIFKAIEVYMSKTSKRTF
jgi:DNA (cytosine-5)-methyltransferase 1